MGKEICTVCGREIDSRGMSGHMKIHKADEGDGSDGGVISYPSGDESTHPEGDESIDEIGAQGKRVKKTVKKQVKKQVKKRAASKPASSSTSKPDAGGQHKTEKEWQGLFRD